MSPADQIQEIERNLETAKALVETNSAFQRLLKNSDFKHVITEGYLQKEAIRLVKLKAEASMASPEKQALILRDIDSIGSLHQYFTTIVQLAGMAERSIVSDEATHAELLAEGA